MKASYEKKGRRCLRKRDLRYTVGEKHYLVLLAGGTAGVKKTDPATTVIREMSGEEGSSIKKAMVKTEWTNPWLTL